MEMWPVYHLWLEGKIQMSEFNKLSIDDIQLGEQALTAWQEATERMRKKAEQEHR